MHPCLMTTDFRGNATSKGWQAFWSKDSYCVRMVNLSMWVGQGFDSPLLHQYGAVAQLAEQATFNREVGSSILPSPTKYTGCGVMVAHLLWEQEERFKSDTLYQ